jgi:hypothetical protein
MVHIDMALGVFRDAVRVAVLNVRRERAPVMDTFVLMIAFSKDGKLGAGLIVGLDEEGNCGGSRGRG